MRDLLTQNGYGTKIVVRCELEWGNRALTEGIVLAVHDRGQAQGFAAIIKVNLTQKLIAMALNKP